jgi:hypothetical protein
VAAGFELEFGLLGLEVHERGEQKDHVAALVKDGRVAVVAAHLAGKVVLNGLCRGVVPLEVVVALGEVDVGLLENGSPLEGSGYEVRILVVFSTLVD